MFTKCFERDGEVINISDYGFEWYDIEGRLLRSGLVEDLLETIDLLIGEGWIEVL